MMINIQDGVSYEGLLGLLGKYSKSMLVVGPEKQCETVVVKMKQWQSIYKDVQMFQLLTDNYGQLYRDQIKQSILQQTGGGSFGIPWIIFWEKDTLKEILLGVKLESAEQILSSTSGHKEPDIDIPERYINACREALRRHNVVRSKHVGTRPLVLCPKLCRDAQEHADKLCRERGGQMVHSTNTERPGQGENLAMTTGRPGMDNFAVDACQMWYDEISDYSYSNPGFSSGTGHFTQVIWSESTKFGLGIQDRPQGGYMVVGRYAPAGNYRGQYQENVKPLK